MAAAVVAQLRAVGIDAALDAVPDWKRYASKVGSELTPLYEFGWGNDSYDADYTLSALFTSTSKYASFSTPELDGLIKEAAYELDPKKRVGLYSQALHIIEEQAPWIFLFQMEDVYGTGKNLAWQARSDELFFIDEMRFKS